MQPEYKGKVKFKEIEKAFVRDVIKYILRTDDLTDLPTGPPQCFKHIKKMCCIM